MKPSSRLISKILQALQSHLPHPFPVILPVPIGKYNPEFIDVCSIFEFYVSRIIYYVPFVFGLFYSIFPS